MSRETKGQYIAEISEALGIPEDSLKRMSLETLKKLFKTTGIKDSILWEDDERDAIIKQGTSLLDVMIGSKLRVDNPTRRLMSLTKDIMDGKPDVEAKRKLLEGKLSIDSTWGGLVEYLPMPQQIPIHQSRARVIVVKGGNRAGKSTSVLADLAYQLQMPGRLGFLPVRAWVFRPKFADLLEEDPVYEKLWYGKIAASQQMMPFIAPVMQHKLMSRQRVMKLKNGSTVTTWSYNQRTTVIAGQEPNIIVADEELPKSKFNEIAGRLLSGSGTYLMIGATLTESEPYIQELETRWKQGDPLIDVFTLLTQDNENLDTDQVDFALSLMDESEKTVRIYGGSRQDLARVYTFDDRKNWKDISELPENGTDYVFIDPGIGAYTGVLWIRAVPNDRQYPDGRIQCDLWIHREYYQRGKFNIIQLADEIMDINGELQPAEWFMDPFYSRKRIASTANVQEALTYQDMFNEAMAKYGIKARLGPNTRDMKRGIRAMKSRQWVDLDDKTVPDIYAIRGMKHFAREVANYVVKGLMRSPDEINTKTAEHFAGEDHLIFNMESAVEKRIEHVETQSAIKNKMNEEESLSQTLWESLTPDPEEEKVWFLP